jgi:hypothetical protein
MTELDEVAVSMFRGYAKTVQVPTKASALQFVKNEYDKMPGNGWQDWVTPQQLDGIADSLYKIARYMMD